MEFAGMNAEEAKDFASRWLPTWTGNDPELLTSFYTEDGFYSDERIREGVRGRAAILKYFEKLLAENPKWVWTHTGSIPIRDGFLNKWHASIPVGDKVIEATGVCTAQIRDGKIYSNEVFFDRSELVQAIMKERGSSKSE